MVGTIRVKTVRPKGILEGPGSGKLRAAKGLLTFSLAALAVVAPSYAEEPAKPTAPAPPRPQAAAPAAPKPAEEVTPEQMQGVSFEGLTDTQKALAFSVLKDNKCDCGCGMNFATCRVKDVKCKRSLDTATQVISLAKAGKSRDDVLKTAFPPAPWKFVQFSLTAGDAFALGPADAKVTILHYLDYQ